VVAGGRRGKDDRKQKTLAPLTNNPPPPPTKEKNTRHDFINFLILFIQLPLLNVTIGFMNGEFLKIVRSTVQEFQTCDITASLVVFLFKWPVAPD
jgi:hypothetical protein